MVTEPHSGTIARPSNADPRRYSPGDLVVQRGGEYPLLCEVILLQPDGLLRVRGLDWAAGYSALIDPQDVRPVSAIAARATQRD
jgi:hypothetical protein